MTRVAIIADDLTGALDTASPFACRGARVFCLTEANAFNAADLTGFDVLSISTNSRHLPPQQAAKIARSAAENVKRLKPDIVLKKIDSRLKGNIAVEAEEVTSVFGFTSLLAIPAAPDIGRFVQHGKVLGHGVEHALSIPDTFAALQLPMQIPDVTSREAMSDQASIFLSDPVCLPVCSRGFAVALAEKLFLGPILPIPQPLAPVLIAIGSRDPVTAAQRHALCSQTHFTCVEAPEGHVPDDLSSSARMLLYCGGKLGQQPEQVMQYFAGGVVRLMRSLSPQTLLCSGGETALAVLRQCGLTALNVIGEVAPGLPISVVKYAGLDLSFISKSGGFGGVSTLLEVFANESAPLPTT